jgi:hypothetical protein
MGWPQISSLASPVRPGREKAARVDHPLAGRKKRFLGSTGGEFVSSLVIIDLQSPFCGH